MKNSLVFGKNMEKTRTRTQIKEHKPKRRIFFPVEPKPSVRTPNKLKRFGSLLGSQYTYNVGLRFPTLGDSNLETQQYLPNLCIAFLSLFITIILGSKLSSQTFQQPPSFS